MAGGSSWTWTCAGLNSGTNAPCSEAYVGTINVSSNISSSWTITGPSPQINDSGISKSYPSLTAGLYNIIWNSVTGYNTPAQQSLSIINNGDTINFSGTYIPSCGTAQDRANSAITYGTVIAKDGNCWLDRNLGATEVATSATDYKAYGSLFQWGRLDDGHELMNWTGPTPPAGNPVNGETATLATSDTPYTYPNGIFIRATLTSSNFDWKTDATQNDNLWQNDGTNKNNPCPTGFRLPTSAEWTTLASSGAENITNLASAFNSTLKLPTAGMHFDAGSIIDHQGSSGEYWSSSLSSHHGVNFFFNSSLMGTALAARALGQSVRCIKDIPTYKLTISAGDGTEVKSSDGYIDCKNNVPIGLGACYHNYAIGTPLITLTETTDVGYSFIGWSGDCSGTGGTCAVTMNAAKNVTTNASLVCFCDTVTNRCPGNEDDSCGNHNVCPDGTKTTGCGGGGLAPGIWKEVAP